VKVFLDTNVLVSAFLARGLCADLVELVVAEHELLTGEVVLSELENVLSERFGFPRDRIKTTIAYLRDFHVEPLPSQLPEVSISDPDDLWVLASAGAADADVLVTGDSDLLAIQSSVEIKIITPRGLWEILRRNPSPS